MKIGDLITPRWCRWDSKNPPKLTVWHCVLYGCAGGFFSANLFYSHPILDVLAHDFNTTQAGVANIPTLAQAGDATGLLLILPLADYFPRRKFSLVLLAMAIIFWIGLCITDDLNVFSALTYLSAVFTGVMQVFIVLVTELSDPSKRAFNIAIVGAGPTLGILLARILSGVVATFTPWRNVYYLALALQIFMLILLYLFMPDYPPTNRKTPLQILKLYPRTLVSIVTMNFRHPVLMQASLLSFLTFFAVSSYWTTLTFLLSEPHYNYTPLVIGLFGLIGASTMVLGPVYGKYIIQPINTPLVSALIGKAVSFIGVAIGTFTGNINIAGPVIEALFLDAGLIILQIASRMGFHDVEPLARNQVNTAFVAMLYLGMLAGTKASNVIYEKNGGWVPSGGLSLGMVGLGFVVIALRGPHVAPQTWFGWSGGWGKVPEGAAGEVSVVAAAAAAVTSDTVREGRDSDEYTSDVEKTSIQAIGKEQQVSDHESKEFDVCQEKST